jgi:hypothetical protein
VAAHRHHGGGGRAAVFRGETPGTGTVLNQPAGSGTRGTRPLDVRQAPRSGCESGQARPQRAKDLPG